MTHAALLGLDWGTTSARAYRLAADGALLGVRTAPLGILQVQDGRFAAALDALLGDWQGDSAPRLACGMIGSRQGWREAPYCDTPGTLTALAHRIVEVPDARLAIVPGLATRDATGMPDVMRGEETQIVGSADPSAARAWVVLPGTHSKWARIERGAIAAFSTFMTGELFAALLDHTILGRLATVRGGAFQREVFVRGVDRALAGGPLTHDLFGARTHALFGELDGAAVPDWLSGVLIGAELAAMRGHVGGDVVTVVADEALTERYRVACGHAGMRAEAAAPPHAAARGLWRIACAAGLVRSPVPV